MSHRITNGMMVDTFTRNLVGNQNRMNGFQNQLATNKRITRLSDDPVGSVKSVSAKVKLNDIEQYQKNLRDADATITAAETALKELNELLKRGMELAVQASNDVLTLEDKAAIAAEIRQLRDQVVTVSNATVGNRYIFGGYNTTSEPFKAENGDPTDVGIPGDITINGVSMLDDDGDPEFLSYEIGFGVEFSVGISANQLLGLGKFDLNTAEGNVWSAFDTFYQALVSEDPESSLWVDNSMDTPSLQPFIQFFQTAQQNTLNMISEVGGRLSRVYYVEDRFGQDVINYTMMKSDVEDIDQAETIMKFSMQETVYRASLDVGARVIQPTLLDFLR